MRKKRRAAGTDTLDEQQALPQAQRQQQQQQQQQQRAAGTDEMHELQVQTNRITSKPAGAGTVRAAIARAHMSYKEQEFLRATSSDTLDELID